MTTSETWDVAHITRLIRATEEVPRPWFDESRIVDPDWAVTAVDVDPSSEPEAGPLTRELGRYTACVPVVTAHRAPSIGHDAYSSVADASTALGRHDGDSRAHALAPAVARLTALVEAITSSEMEGIRASITDVAHSLADPRPARRATDDVSLVADHFRSVVTANEVAFTNADEASATTFAHDLHKTLMTRSRPEIAGRARNCPVWIGGGFSRSPHSAAFVPPVSGDVGAYLADLDAWSERDDVATVALAAIAHAQFETIHPYADGNGRVGRTLIASWLRRNGALSGPVPVPLSWNLSKDKRSYIEALIAYRYGDLDQIVEVICDAIQAGAYFTSALAMNLSEIHARWTNELAARPDAVVWRVLDIALAGHVVNANDLAYDLDVSYPTANAAIAQLVDIGALTLVSEQRRNRSFIAAEVTELVSSLMHPKRGSGVIV